MTDKTPLTDLDLVHLVKEKNDSQALIELTNRHSGIYCAIAQRYSGFSDKIQLEEIKEDKQYNIYKWIMSYKEDKNMKIGTYIGQMTKYLCLDILSQTPEKVEISEVKEPITVDSVAEQSLNDDSMEQAKIRANQVSDPRFWTIFKMRHLGDKTASWRKIGKEVGLSYQGAINLYNRHITKVKDFIT